MENLHWNGYLIKSLEYKYLAGLKCALIGHIKGFKYLTAEFCYEVHLGQQQVPTILVAGGNASVGGTFLVDVASAVSGACLFLDGLTILHAFPMTSVGPLKVPLSLCPLRSPFFFFLFFLKNL